MAGVANTITGLMPTFYEALDKVSREMVGFIPSVSRDASESMAAIGDTIRVPVTTVGAAGTVAPGVIPPEAAGLTVGYTDMAITKSRYVPIHWNGEQSKSLMNGKIYYPVLADQVMQAIRTLANEIETDLAALYIYASRAIGAGGTNPFATTIGNSALVRKVLADNGAPMGNLKMVVDTSAGAQLRTLTHLTQADSAGSDATLRRGILLDLNGFQIRESAQVKAHTLGATSGDSLSGTPAIGSTVLAVGGTFIAGAFAPGDVLTIADDANKYVITSVDVSGQTITIAAPGLRKTGINGKALSLESFTANMAFDGNAIKLLARAPAVPPEGDNAMDRTIMVDPISGLPFEVSVYKGYRQVYYEVSIAWGVKLLKPEHTALLLG